VIRFQCTCGKPLKVEDSVAGCTAKCPHCGNQVRVPEPEPEPMSGPAALRAAIREARESAAADDIPTAEVIEGLPAARRPAAPASPEAAQAIKGLDALARAAGTAPASRPAPARRAAKPTRLAPKPKGRGRKANKKPAPSALPNGRPSPAGEHSKKAAIIGAVAAVVVLIIAVIAASFIGGGEAEPAKKPPTEAPPVTTTAEQPKRKGYAFDQPGALFGGVGELDEGENPDGTTGQP